MKTCILTNSWKLLVCTVAQNGSGQDSASDSDDSYVGAVLARSPPPDPLAVVPIISELQIKSRSMPSRISSLFKILVSIPYTWDTASGCCNVKYVSVYHHSWPESPLLMLLCLWLCFRCAQDDQGTFNFLHRHQQFITYYMSAYFWVLLTRLWNT